MPQKRRPSSFPLTIRSRESLLFEGAAESLTSFNSKGEFDILALHANFISLIQKAVVVRRNRKIIQRFPVNNGVLVVRNGRAEVYLGVSR